MNEFEKILNEYDHALRWKYYVSTNEDWHKSEKAVEEIRQRLIKAYEERT